MGNKGILILGALAFGVSPAWGRVEFAPGELLVKLKPTVAKSARVQAVSSVLDTVEAREIASGGLMHVKLPKGTDLTTAMKEMQADPQVESVQLNYRYHLAAVPNDPKYAQLWGLKNSSQTIVNDPSIAGTIRSTNNPGVSGKDMRLESAWNVVTDCSSLVVAVIDTGVNYAHPELAANMWSGGFLHGADFVDGDNSGNGNGPMDLNGHGTHVAGTIGAIGNNGSGTVGICWKAKIMAIRALDAAGSGFTSTLVQSIDFARQNGAKVINMSLAGGTYDTMLEAAVNNASNAGIVIAVAAGNEAENNDSTVPSYPCNYTAANLICVAALDQSYQLASFSNTGALSVDVGAPGVNILSTWPKITESNLYTDTFNNGGVLNWTVSGTGSSTWGYGAKALSPDGNPSLGSFHMLLMPSNWNGTSIGYANNVDRKVYKTFDLSSIVDSALMKFVAYLDTESGYDPFEVYMKSTGGDPTSGGILVDQMSGSGDADYGDTYEYDVSRCISSSCSLGFRFVSDSTGNGTGVGIVNLRVVSASVDRSEGYYMVSSGTSMASPQVAGIAALLFAYNPDFGGSEVIRAIKNGGIAVSSLNGVTTTGKAADAFGALTYIATPTGVSASVQ